MATVNYYFRGRQDSGNLTVRFTHTRNIDIKCATGIVVPNKSWDQKKQRVRNVGEMKVSAKINEKLLSLESYLISKFNLDYMEGLDINFDWLQKSVLKFFNRPAYEAEKKIVQEKQIYFVSFCNSFFENVIESGKWKNPKTKKPLPYKSVQHYKKAINFLEEYETSRRTRIKHRELSLDFCDDFCKFMKNSYNGRVGYSQNYIAKTISRIKFYCARAEEDNIEINKIYKSRMFSAPTEQTLDPYLNEEELDIIFSHDFSESERLDATRDWLIIGCYTGLRVSDFLGDKKWPGLSMDHIEMNEKGDFYIHLTTRKTGATTTIPVHNKVKAILEKRGWQFPHHISSQKFNEYVKEVCELAGIDQEIMASIKDPDTNRKVKKLYPKYKAVSSHICRRSFATNHHGKLGTWIIMAIGGWSTESAYRKYLKKSGFEAAEEVKDYWDKEELRKIK